jgi:hypothetical protein
LGWANAGASYASLFEIGPDIRPTRNPELRCQKLHKNKLKNPSNMRDQLSK